MAGDRSKAEVDCEIDRALARGRRPRQRPQGRLLATGGRSIRRFLMHEELDRLLEQAKRVKMTPAQQEEQRRSFAYGNTKIENDLITRQMIDEAAERLANKG